MAEHTPGPWDCQESEIGTIEIFSDTRDEIANIPLDDSDESSLEETKANARLLKAAPALLAFAQQFISRPCEFGNDTCWPHGTGTSCLPCQARAIVAQAKGGDRG